MAGTRLVVAENCSTAQPSQTTAASATSKPTLPPVRLSPPLCPRSRQLLYYLWLPLVLMTLVLVYAGRWNEDNTWIVFDNEGKIIYRNSQDRTKKLPQCIIIGIRKCGTRALLEFLNLHPEIAAAKDEMHFFDKDARYKLGLQWYQEQMPSSFSEQVTVEKSPAYFITEGVPERIHHMNDTVKLLLIVRDPTTRTLSDYTQIYSNRHARNQTFPTFESLVLDSSGKVTTFYKAVRISLYDFHMKRWLKTFQRDQIHIVDGDKLVTHPASELHKVEDFLGLSHYLNEDKFYFNRTRGFYCMRNHTGYKCLGASKGRRHPEVAPSVMDKLRNFFEPHNKLFFNMTGRTFNWS